MHADPGTTPVSDQPTNGQPVGPTAETNPCTSELLTSDELSEFLGVSTTKLTGLIRHQDLMPAVKMGGEIRYRRSEVLLWLERFRVEKPSRQTADAQ